MNLQQLEYILAVDSERHFQRAAEKCFVTQATLSMMIRKLEEELGAKIFDRSKHPVEPTEIGMKVIAQARRVVAGARRVKEMVAEEKGTIRGELRLGIIPTLAPYLLPRFLSNFSERYPELKLIISEHTTETIIHLIKSGHLDFGLLATPLNDPLLRERPLFYERYYLYVSDREKGYNKHYILPTSIDVKRLWLLEEGHCMRSQILNLCELKKKAEVDERIHYEAGSIETLKNIVERNLGITIIPELSVLNLTARQKKRLRYFRPPAPVREISIVTGLDFIKDKLLEALQESILTNIPESMTEKGRRRILEIS